MASQGFSVGISVDSKVECAIVRGFTMLSKDSYPCGNKLLQTWNENRKTLFMSEYFPVVQEWSIPTFFVETLNPEVERLIAENGWEKAFIKSNAKSLFAVSDVASVWPETSIKEIASLYRRFKRNGPFAIRKFIDDPEIFYNEQRYWVLNGRTYHPSGIIPDFVAEAGRRLYAFSGSHYFTIDVAGDYIVEVNPGESSDRGGDNPLDFFCEVFAKEFLK